MAYYVRYLIQVNKNGKARPSLYIHTSDADKVANQIWYAFGSYGTDPNLPWDSANGTVSGSATESWSHEIQRTGGDNTTPMIRATFDRTNMILYLSSGSGTYNPQTHIYENATGLFAFPAQFDCSGYEWTQGQANENYAQLNINADFAVQASEEHSGTSGEIFPQVGPSPIIVSATLTAKQVITVGWTAASIIGNQGTSIAPQLTLQYSTDGGNTWTNSGTVISGSSGTTAVSNLAKATVYYWRIVANWPTLDVTAYSNEDKWAQTVTPLAAPAKSSFGVTALDGVGSVSWGSVDNAASYLLGLVDSESANPSSSSSVSSPWSFNETSSGQTVQGKYVKVKSVAASNSIEYENSGWSEAVLIPDNRTPQGEDPITPVEINMTRRIYKAIPYIDVPVEQIGGGGSVQDVITVEYANAHYAAIGDAITPSTLPIAKADELGAIKVGTHLSINAETGVLSVSSGGSIASGDTGLVTGGTVYTEINKYAAFKNKTLETSVASGNANAITGGAVYTFVTTVSNLPKAKAAGGSGNAGVVYVTNATDKNGLIIDGTNDGLIKVDFAGTSSVTWNSTVANKVANPKYVKMAIEGYVADSTNVTATGGSPTYANRIVKLNGDGVIDESMLKVVSVTNFYEAANQTAMLALSSAQDGDICIRTDEHKTYILMSDGAENGYATASNWKELTAPTGTVTSVNGKAGATVTLSLTDIYASGTTKVTIDQSISSTAIGTENYHFPTSKAVQGYVSGQITALNLGGAATYSVATWTAGTTAWDTGGTGLTTANYLKNALTDFKSDLTYSDVGAAAASHTHPIGEITYTISSTNYTASIASSISSSSTHGQIPTAKAVYDYKPLITRITATGSTVFGGVTTDLSSYSSSSENYYIPTSKAVQTALAGKANTSHNQAITTIYATGTTAFAGTVTAFGSYTASSEDYQVATAYAIKQALAGKANTSHNQAITTIYATGTTAFAGTVTAFSSYTASSEDYKVATAYAIKQALAGKAASSHTHISAQISDAISTVDDPEASSSFGKVVKTEADWGQINASLIPIDDNSITLVSDTSLQVSTSWLYDTLDGRYLKPATAASTYLARSNADASDWTSGTSYSVGQLVFAGTSVWRCIQANTATSLNGPGGAVNIDSGNNYVYWVPVTVEFSNRYDGTITGNGSATEFTITHKLGVKDVDVVLIDNTTDQEVFAAVTMYSATQVKIGFGTAPASGKVYRVIVRR